MLDKLQLVEERYAEMNERSLQPDFYNDPKAATKLLREQRQLEPIVETFRAYKKTKQEQQDLREMLDGQLDPDMRELCREEFTQSVLEEAAREVVAAGTPNTRTVTVNLTYQDGSWWVLPDEGLLKAISGGIL